MEAVGLTVIIVGFAIALSGPWFIAREVRYGANIERDMLLPAERTAKAAADAHAMLENDRATAAIPPGRAGW